MPTAISRAAPGALHAHRPDDHARRAASAGGARSSMSWMRGAMERGHDADGARHSAAAAASAPPSKRPSACEPRLQLLEREPQRAEARAAPWRRRRAGARRARRRSPTRPSTTTSMPSARL